jgi:single-strand DNA-binding protein
MKDVNKIILIGRLGADPVLRETKNGATVVHFPVATSRRVKSTEPVTGGSETNGAEVARAEDSKTEETQWHRIVAWGRQGETCALYLKKGQKVYVEGSFQSRKYEAKDGTERVSFEVIAETVSFLGGGRSYAADGGETAEPRLAVNG